jgi:hypothetical protein
MAPIAKPKDEAKPKEKAKPKDEETSLLATRKFIARNKPPGITLSYTFNIEIL